MHLEQTTERPLTRFAPLQAIVCCPQSRTPLTLVPLEELLRRLPASERDRVPPHTEGAFVSEASARAYPIHGGIADFLEQDTLHLADRRTLPAAELDADAAGVKQRVKDWYDRFGWKRNEAGLYYDTALFSELEMTGHGLYALLSHLSLVGRLSGGEFLLDAASGAIAHPEYLTYSWYYKYRVCVDMSLTALQEAEAKLGGKGFCCLADICRLPFRGDVFDGVISLYTIQHIPQTEQGQAVRELYRVLSPNRNMCVITGRTNSWAHKALILLLRALRKIKRLFSRRQATLTAAAPDFSKQPHGLYHFVPHLKWWRKLARDLGASCTIEGLRLFEKFEFEWIFGNSMHAARRIRSWESSFPRLAARMSPCLLIDLRKKGAEGR